MYYWIKGFWLANPKMSEKIEKVGYITLAQAAQSSPYSQEYMGLLARKGMIEAKKIGRNWYTTAEALQRYLARQEQALASKMEKMGKLPLAGSRAMGALASDHQGSDTIHYAGVQFNRPYSSQPFFHQKLKKELPRGVLVKFMRDIAADGLVLGLIFGVSFMAGVFGMNVIRMPDGEMLRSAVLVLGKGVMGGWQESGRDISELAAMARSEGVFRVLEQGLLLDGETLIKYFYRWDRHE